MRTNNSFIIAGLVALLLEHGVAFSVTRENAWTNRKLYSTVSPSGSVSLAMASSAPVESKTTGGFIETELRGKAMKLHTRSQAPKEGKAQDKKMEPYTPTRDDYLRFLVDSQHIYRAFEDVVNGCDELAVFRSTGLERVEPLETDIDFMVQEYSLVRPDVGKPGLDYAEEIRRLGKERLIPEFLCHYYNFYFAHTAGGRMIGKQMSALLLDKRTLEFYKVRSPTLRWGLK